MQLNPPPPCFVSPPRDVSLENIVLTVTGEVKIIDFGLALRSGQHRPQGPTANFDGANPFNARSISPTGPFGKKHYSKCKESKYRR